MLKVGDLAMYEATAMHSGTSNTEATDRDVISMTYTWRDCPATHFGNLSDCAECFHCAWKSGWKESPHGANGPNGQREILAANHAAQLAQMRGIVEQMRSSPEYAQAVRKIRQQDDASDVNDL